MNAQQMWKAYARKNRIQAPYTAWAYGSASDELAKLTFDGVKTATASAYPLYAVDEEPLPQVGEYSVILDSQDEAVCIIQCTKVSIVPFRKVTEEHAYKEGEGDRSLAYWRQVHQEIFTQWLQEVGLKFTLNTEVVCEEFTRVYP